MLKGTLFLWHPHENAVSWWAIAVVIEFYDKQVLVRRSERTCSPSTSYYLFKKEATQGSFKRNINKNKKLSKFRNLFKQIVS